CDVATGVKVEPPIAVVIEKHGAGMKQRSEICTVYMRLVGNVRKRAVPIVVIEKILTVLRHIKIKAPVIIVIAPYAAETKPGSGDSRGVSYDNDGRLDLYEIGRAHV